MYDTSTGRWDYGAGLVLAGLLGVSVGMISGIGYARRYLLPVDAPATAADGGQTRSVNGLGVPEPSTVHPGQPPMPVRPALTRAPDLGIDQPRLSTTVRVPAPEATPPAAEPAPEPEAISPSPRQVASMLEEPTTRPFKLSRDRQLFTCPDASHLASTTIRAGRCTQCNQRLVSAGTVTHGLQAMMAFDRKRREPPSTVVASTQPASSQPSRTGHVLYACRRPEHVAATTDGPGACSQCGVELVPATTVPHALDVMRFQAAKERRGSATGATSRPALYACLVREHVASTTDKPGACATCQLTLMPVERVGHSAMAIQAWETAQRAVTPVAERREPSLPALYTCPDVQHGESTGRRPGACPMCGLALRSVYEVVHQVEAIRAYAKARAARQARTATSRPTTTQP